jgi:uncharacterized protein YjbI with pentapeptide repeats
MNDNLIKSRFERLKEIRWGSARKWSVLARDLLLDYYEKVLPFWPEKQVRLMPHSSVLTEAFSSRLSPIERERVNLMLLAILETYDNYGFTLTSVNRALVVLILISDVLIESGNLAPQEDPSEPLLRLFEEGYDLNPSHGAVDICYQFGCTSVPLPTRESVMQRFVSHTFDNVKILQELLKQQRTARDLELKGADLRGVQLSGLRADGLDFEEADLRESSLTEVKWKGCILREARLDGADFRGAVLRLCDLDQARATNATFIGARLENSTACGARFDGTDLAGAVLIDTDFSRASFHGANLEGVSASGASFRGADLSGTRLRSADLTDTDLRGADLTGVDLQGADLHGADLRGAIGIDPALQKEESRWGELPPAMRDLTETMTPIVIEALRTAGRSGAIDPEVAGRLIKEAARHQSASPRNAPSQDTLEAVSRVLGKLGDNVLPALIGALQNSDKEEPPPEVKALILRLREELGLDESASVEDVLSRLTGGIGRSPQKR